MRRRELITGLAGAALVPHPSRSQPRGVPILGRLHFGAAIDAIEAEFSRALGEAGYIEGKNVTIERRSAVGRYDQIPALLDELLRLRPAVIITGGNVVALLAKRATSTVPIIFNIASDPVKLGLVSSLAQPGGNATGIATLTAPLTAKRLELIQELIPAGSTIGFLVNPDNQDALPAVEHAANASGRSVQIAEARDRDDLQRAFETFYHARVAAVVVSNDISFFAQRDQLIALASRHSLPAIYEWREFSAAGGLMSYGPSLPRLFHQLGVYAARILDGAQPRDLPVQQPTTFELVINLKTAKSLNLSIPPTLLARADEVIE